MRERVRIVVLRSHINTCKYYKYVLVNVAKHSTYVRGCVKRERMGNRESVAVKWWVRNREAPREKETFLFVVGRFYLLAEW